MIRIVKITSFTIIMFLLLSGCSNRVVMVCHKEADSYFVDISKEVTNVTFYSDKTVKEEIIATVKDKSTIDSVSERLQKKYCYSNLDEGYKCSVSHNDNSIILKKSGDRKDIINNKATSIRDYQKIFEIMGFKCKR